MPPFLAASCACSESPRSRLPSSPERQRGDLRAGLCAAPINRTPPQVGASVYAECQVISLSRKPLIGMRDVVQSRASNSLTATLRQTRNRALHIE